MARVGGLEPPGPVLETGSVATSLTPSFSKSNKKPGLSRVWCAPQEMHSDPQDTTPQMTRFVVILTMSRLKVLSIASIHRHSFESYCSTTLERPAGFEPAYTSFVAKAIYPLWHGRLKPGRGTQNRTESTCSQGTNATHYTIPRWCQPSELNAALSVFSGAYRPRIRDWRNLVDLVGSAPTASALQVRRSP